MKISKVILTGLLLAGVSFTAMAGVPNDPSTITGAAGVNLSAASITTVKPLVVEPGTLVVVEGEGFGTKPGTITVGNQTINQFLGWGNTYIFFRVPAAVAADSYVKVGSAVSESALQPAPAGSLKIVFVVDTSKVTTDGLSASLKEKLTNPNVAAQFVPPLYFKGSFSHADGTFGFKDDMWGGGAKWRMLNPRGTIWMTELVVTPDAIASFKNKNNPLVIPGVKFAFEDGNLDRNIGEFESDFAMSLKKSFQKQSGSAGNDPVAYLVTTGKKSSWYDGWGKKVVAEYPARAVQ